MLSDLFFTKLRELGERHRTDPLVYLDVWNSESHLDPRAFNASSGAQGLNQMIPATLAGLGAPPNFRALAGEDQIPWIEKLIAGGEALNGGPFSTAERYYHSNFFPRTMQRGQSPGTVVVSSTATDPQERQAYAANKGLDGSGKGWIDYTDLRNFLARAKVANKAVYDDARTRLGASSSTTSTAPSTGTGATIVLGIAGLGAAIAGGRALARRYPLGSRRRRSVATPRVSLAREEPMGRIVIHRSRASKPSELAIAGGIAGGLALVVGLVALAGRKSASASGPQPPPNPPPLPPPPPPRARTWNPATTINPGDFVRASISIPAFLQFAKTVPGGLPSGSAGWSSYLQQFGTAITGGTTSQTLLTWGPGDALPSDWPTDDVDQATEYHTEFTYAGAAPVLVSALPIPLRVWVQTVAGVQPPKALAWHAVGLSGHSPAGHPVYTAMNPGDRVRLTIAPLPLRQQALAVNYAPNELGLVQLIAKTWIDSTVLFAGTDIVTYVPGAALPADWPTDDAAAATGYHAEFTYHGPISHERPQDATMWVGTPS